MSAVQASELAYQIKGTVHQVVEMHLNAGQRVYSETGGMIWMDAAPRGCGRRNWRGIISKSM